jgi:hypothetical protein
MIGSPDQGGNVKRLLPTIPIILFLLLNACGAVPGSSLDVPGNWTAIVQPLTATVWTPNSTPFYTPYIIKELFDILNADLPNAHTLEWTFDAEYTVTDVEFHNEQNGPGMFLRMDIRCLCKKENCCFLERTFVVVIDSMKKNADNTVPKIPDGVTRIVVVCWDYKKYNGALSVAWKDMKDYLRGNITGRQFSERVTRTAVP